jgi:glutathione S-transferase
VKRTGADTRRPKPTGGNAVLKIWGRESSTNVQKVLWTCAELDVPYDRIDVGGPFGGLDTVSYRSLNPNRLIPTIEDGEFVLWESHAIIRYLAAGDAQQRLLPPSLTRRTRAQIDQWLDWAMVGLGLNLRNLFMLVSKPVAQRPAAADIETATAAVARLFEILDARLGEVNYVGGGDFTLADIPCGISTHRWLSLPIARPALPALESWYARIKGRSAFRVIRSISAR